MTNRKMYPWNENIFWFIFTLAFYEEHFLFLFSKLHEECKSLVFFYLLQSCLVWISKSRFDRRIVYNISQAMAAEIEYILIIFKSTDSFFSFLCNFYFNLLWTLVVSFHVHSERYCVLCSGLETWFTVFSENIISGLFLPDNPQLQY